MAAHYAPIGLGWAIGGPLGAVLAGVAVIAIAVTLFGGDDPPPKGGTTEKPPPEPPGFWPPGMPHGPEAA